MLDRTSSAPRAGGNIAARAVRRRHRRAGCQRPHHLRRHQRRALLRSRRDRLNGRHPVRRAEPRLRADDPTSSWWYSRCNRASDVRRTAPRPRPLHGKDPARTCRSRPSFRAYAAGTRRRTVASRFRGTYPPPGATLQTGAARRTPGVGPMLARDQQPRPSPRHRPPARPELRVFRPDSPYVALGLAVNHLMTKPAFAELQFGEWSRILVGQINRKHYFFVVDAQEPGPGLRRLGGHHQGQGRGLGRGARRAGLRGQLRRPLHHLQCVGGEQRQVNRFLLQEARKVMLGKEWVYCKRHYKDGTTRTTRLQVTEFVDAASRADANADAGQAADCPENRELTGISQIARCRDAAALSIESRCRQMPCVC